VEQNYLHARPSLLTPERSAAIIDMVRSGAFVKTACKAAGVGESTLSDWLRRADDPEADRVCCTIR
jgi:transposase